MSQAASRPDLEALVLAFGTDPAFAEAVLGDLAEEYAVRAERHGAGAARRWYAREAVRSAPHLIRSAVRRVVRHGSARERARLAGALAAVVLALSGTIAAVLTRNGPPARLVIGRGAGATDDGVVVNGRRPVRLPIQVLDAVGHPLDVTRVRYQSESRAPIPVTAAGVVTCTRPAEVTVRAALGSLTTRVVVHCAPVRELRAIGWGDFVLGDTARALTVDAVGVDGRRVTRVAPWLRVDDTTVVRLDGPRLRPLRPGMTLVNVRVGDTVVGTRVTVFEPVPTLAGLRPGQRFVAAPVRLAPGESVTWPLPAGPFDMRFVIGLGAEAAPRLRVAGAVMCMPALRPGVTDTRCVARGPGATVIVAVPGRPLRGPGAPDVVGSLALAREEDHPPEAPAPSLRPPL